MNCKFCNSKELIKKCYTNFSEEENDSFSDICFVEIAMPILNNKSSYIHNLMPLYKQSATKSSSFSCPFSNSFAFGRNCTYSFNGTNIIISKNKSDNCSSISLDNFDLEIISSLCLLNYSLSLSGANNLRSSEKTNDIMPPCEINILINKFESMITSNYIKPFFFKLSCIPLDIFSANSKASFSDSFDLDTNVFNLLNCSCFFSSRISSSLANSDQFTHDNSFILLLNSSEIFNAMLTIYNSPLSLIFSNLSRASALFCNLDFNTSGQLTSGNSSIFFFNSIGMDNVSVGILLSPIYKQYIVNIHKYVNIFKSFVLADENYHISKNVQRLYPNKNSIKSSVVNTFTKFCLLRCGSFDQMAALIESANARKSMSSGSDKEALAFLKNSSYSEDLKNFMSNSTSFCLASNCCSESFDLNKHSSLCSFSSDLINSGAKNSSPIEKNKYDAIESGFINEKNILLSNTSFILVYSFNNSRLFSGDSSASNFLNLPFFAFLPNSTDHLMKSFSSLELSCSCNLSNDSSLTNSDQLTQDNFFISDLTSSGIANVTDAIYISPLRTNSSNFFNCPTLRIITLLNTSGHFIWGNESIFFLNSSETDNVTVAILPPLNYVNIHKYVDIFKSFALLNEEAIKKSFSKVVSLSFSCEENLGKEGLQDTSLQRKLRLKDWKDRTLRLEIGLNHGMMKDGLCVVENEEFGFGFERTENPYLETRIKGKKMCYEKIKI